jgi:hypothetical protein
MSEDINPLFGLPAWVGDEDHPLTTWPTHGGIDRNQDLESVKSIAERTGIADEVRQRLEDYVSIPVMPPAVYEVLRHALDEANARTGAAPMPPQDAKHGARTVVADDRMVRSAQHHLTSGEHHAIAPTSIDKATREWKFGIDYANGNDTGHVEPLRATPLMRALGYNRHPYDCSHCRKRLMLGSTTWHCQDCGSEV